MCVFSLNSGAYYVYDLDMKTVNVVVNDANFLYDNPDSVENILGYAQSDEGNVKIIPTCTTPNSNILTLDTRQKLV